MCRELQRLFAQWLGANVCIVCTKSPEVFEIKADPAFELIIGLETRPEIGHGA
jgi:hypothetical protein